MRRAFKPNKSEVRSIRNKIESGKNRKLAAYRRYRSHVTFFSNVEKYNVSLFDKEGKLGGAKPNSIKSQVTIVTKHSSGSW